MDKSSYVRTDEKFCRGCNKCIFACPTNANEAFFEADESKVFIKPGFCISCGECLNICDHKARDYVDDTTTFLDDLKGGKKISVVIAPAARFSFESTQRLIGYLKSIGVNKVYDVSFGADICTWGYVKAIKEQNLNGIIAQPCPVVVSYIEKYRPSLIDRLSPVHSPLMCLATYLNKYVGIEEKLMFLSPCIGKKRECTSEDTNDYIDYNVTFNKFLQHLEDNSIDLANYQPQDFDQSAGSLGFTFSRPGGLSENLRLYLGEHIWIKQVEGIKNIQNYFDEYIKDIEDENPIPLVIDALNCEHGCNLGTGTRKDVRLNEIDYVLNKNKQKVQKNDAESLMKYFDEKLNFSDFIRKYTDRSHDYQHKIDIDLEEAFISLNKITQEDREINCFSCGYGSCQAFAYDLALGHNHKNNCKYYLLNKFKKLSLYDNLTGLFNRNCYNIAIKEYYDNHPNSLGIAYIDINGLKEANDIHGHSHGDMLIKTCANLVKKVFDTKAYRIGGDEFIILFDNISEEDFSNKIQQLNSFLENEEHLVVSIGTAMCHSSCDLNNQLDEADKAMYNSKQDYYHKINKADRRSYRRRKH